MRIERIYSVTDVCHDILCEIEAGERTNDYGEYITDYHTLMSAVDGSGYEHCLYIMVIQETDDVEVPFYSIHILDDINQEGGYFQSTDHLSRHELLAVLVETVSLSIERMAVDSDAA